MVLIGEATISPTRYYVQCYDCGTRGPYKYSPEAAIEAWNRIGEKSDNK